MPLSRTRRLRRPSALAALAVAGVLAFGLTGCAGEPAPTPSPAPEAVEPIFASDEAALAAAVEAYEAYRATSAAISADGGEGAERIDAVTTPELATTMHDEFAALVDAGVRMEGVISVDSISLAERSEVDGVAEVSIYLCRDVSAARVIGPDSADVTPADRDDRTPLQSFLKSDKVGSASLLVDEVIIWSGEDFC